MALAGREALNDGTGVPKHDAARAEFIEQIGYQALAGGFITVRKLRGMLLHPGRVAGEEIAICGVHHTALHDAVHHLRHLLVAVGFGEEFVQIAVAVGIKQAEAGEVACSTELLWRGREQQHTRNALGDGFDDLIGDSRRFDGPFEVVGFIHDEEIPTGISGLPRTFGRAAEQRERAEDDLAVEEGIALGITGLDGGTAFFIEEAEHEIETAQQLHEPLMRQRVGNEHEDA